MPILIFGNEYYANGTFGKADVEESWTEKEVQDMFTRYLPYLKYFFLWLDYSTQVSAMTLSLSFI